VANTTMTIASNAQKPAVGAPKPVALWRPNLLIFEYNETAGAYWLSRLVYRRIVYYRFQALFQKISQKQIRQ
jgi:hypothetical protein